MRILTKFLSIFRRKGKNSLLMNKVASAALAESVARSLSMCYRNGYVTDEDLRVDQRFSAYVDELLVMLFREIGEQHIYYTYAGIVACANCKAPVSSAQELYRIVTQGFHPDILFEFAYSAVVADFGARDREQFARIVRHITNTSEPGMFGCKVAFIVGMNYYLHCPSPDQKCKRPIIEFR